MHCVEEIWKVISKSRLGGVAENVPLSFSESYAELVVSMRQFSQTRSSLWPTHPFLPARVELLCSELELVFGNFALRCPAEVASPVLNQQMSIRRRFSFRLSQPPALHPLPEREHHWRLICVSSCGRCGLFVSSWCLTCILVDWSKLQQKYFRR